MVQAPYIVPMSDGQLIALASVILFCVLVGLAWSEKQKARRREMRRRERALHWARWEPEEREREPFSSTSPDS